MNFPYNWKLSNGFPASGIDYHGLTVFTCFAAGGGSSMGYKLAGFEVLGGNEIDPKMAECYKTNLNPKYLFVEDIRDFKKRTDLPEELFNLDILDGSPPCSSFSMAGNREKDWGKEKKFREGQKKQTLDDLFFDFIDLAKKLQPKLVLAENVKGILLGQAMKYRTNYVNRIYKEFDKAGYYCQHWLLDASKMGVPQKRERVFFICLRKDLSEQFLYKKDFFTSVPKLNLKFNKPEITFKEITDLKDEYTKGWEYSIRPSQNPYIDLMKQGETMGKHHLKGNYFNTYKANDNKPLATIVADSGGGIMIHSQLRRYLNDHEYILGGSFPYDYNFLNKNNSRSTVKYIIGMSVPPIMIAQIAHRIYEQWLSKIK